MSFDNGVLSPLSTKTGNNFSVLSPIHHVTTSSPLVTAKMSSPMAGDVLSPLGKDTYSNELYTNTNVISPITTGPSLTINKPTNADLFSTPVTKTDHKDKAAFSIEEYVALLTRTATNSSIDHRFRQSKLRPLFIPSTLLASQQLTCHQRAASRTTSLRLQ